MSQAKTRDELRASALSLLKQAAGTWRAEVEVRPGPGAPPIHFSATARRRLLAGGRWLSVDYQADTGFQGHGAWGFDENAGRLVSTWVDSQLSSLARGEGSWDEEHGTLTFEVAAGTGRYREQYRRLADGTERYSNVVQTGSSEFEMIRATYRRA
jgi:hypothetical protein